jgi:hypothetical protein
MRSALAAFGGVWRNNLRLNDPGARPVAKGSARQMAGRRSTVTAIAVLLVLGACGKAAPPPTGIVNTPELDLFRTVEKATLQNFNDALGRQRANQIDELGLADAIDHKVLPPWRELRDRIAKATIPEQDRELYVTLDRYLAERQTSWEAYSAALRSKDDAQSKPDYAKYHEQNDAATADAKRLGEAFRSLSPRPGS